MRTTYALSLALALISLNGCGHIQQAQEAKSITEMSDWGWFSIKAPQAFEEHIIRDDGSVALTTYDTATTSRHGNDFSVHLYPSLSAPCSPSLTGASQMEPLVHTNGKAEWGRVTRWDEPYHPDIDDAKIICQNNGVAKFTSIYALCSEKDGKTVVICISQMTDNPKQAQEIFETFRWVR